MTRPLKKPSPDFPLTPHSQGYYVKRIQGKMHYFGDRWGDPYAALRDYEFKRPYLEAGLEPPKQCGMTLREGLERFLQAKEQLVAAGELTSRSFDDYRTQCKSILRVIDGSRGIATLLPTDFSRLRESFRGNPTTINNYVVRSRVAFNWIASTQGITFNYGQQFKKPSLKTLRKHRNQQPKKLFTPAEITMLVEAAAPQMKAMILLGVNCGFGNTDCGTINIDSLELDGGWHNHARPKTGVERRAHLWPETVAAIEEVVGTRTTGLAFRTKYGNPWSTDCKSSPISAEFRKTAKALGVKRTFYDLRRTFQTIGDNSLDPVAVKSIMGHVDGSMSGVYRQAVPDLRLKAVSDVVHDWLYKSKDA